MTTAQTRQNTPVPQSNSQGSDAGDASTRILTPLRAIKLKCTDCCCGSAKEACLCPAEFCTLWPFRRGKNPYRAKRTMSAEQRQAACERLAAVRRRAGAA